MSDAGRAPVGWDAIVEGAEPAPLVVGPITLSDVVRYQGASGDMNPIHHDPGFAAKAGFAQPLVIGMWPAGLLATWATDWLGPENVRSIKIRWKSMVWPGDVLSCAGRVVAKREQDGQRGVDLELAATKPDGTVAVQAWMTFVVEG